MKKFIKKIIIFSIVPILLYIPFIFFYIKRDVYCDIGNYQNYSWKYRFQVLGDLSTKKILNSSTKYNSFVFGSSRTCSIYARYLQNKIDNSVFFHYGNWQENIGGIYAKMELLDSLGYKMDNIVFYFDTDSTFQSDGKCINDHYLLTKENKYKYYYTHFKNFIPPYINIERFNLLFFNKAKQESFPNWESDPETNDCHDCTESLLKDYGNFQVNPEYKAVIDSLKQSGFLYKRSPEIKIKEVQISDEEYSVLLKINQLLQKHNTKFYIIITPLYDQYKFNDSDLIKIKNVFGANNVYDFSGVNEFTNNEYNYPDRVHFLPHVSKIIIDSVIVSHQKDLKAK